MKKLFIILVTALSFYSCQQCEQTNTGAVRIKNNSSTPFSVFIDDNYVGQLDGGALSTFSGIKAGSHTIKFDQYYIGTITGTPITKSTTVMIQQCSIAEYTLKI